MKTNISGKWCKFRVPKNYAGRFFSGIFNEKKINEMIFFRTKLIRNFFLKLLNDQFTKFPLILFERMSFKYSLINLREISSPLKIKHSNFNIQIICSWYKETLISYECTDHPISPPPPLELGGGKGGEGGGEYKKIKNLQSM